MLTPEELLHISEGAEEIAEQLHQDILDRIIERIMVRLDRGDNYILTAYDKWQIQVLQDARFLLEDIQNEIAKRTPYMQSEIAEAMEDAGVKSMTYDNKIYEAAGLFPLPLEQSPHLIRLMQRNYEKTLGEMVNFTGTLANAAQQSFIKGCDRAYNLVTSGALGYTQAVKEVVNNIVKDGVIVEYPSGHTDTIETATLRAVRTGVSQATAEITNARMNEMDWDIILVSSHLGARVTDKEDFTNHYWWQGKFYSKSGKDKRFKPFSVCNKDHVQGICGANCRHSYGPGDGEFNPYDQFDSEENQKAYEQQQRQRTLERRIRKTKREVMGLQTARDSALDDTTRAELDLEYQRKSAVLQKQNKAYNDYCEQNGLKKLRDRIDVARWDRKQAAAARGAAKKYQNELEKRAKYDKMTAEIREVGNIPKKAVISIPRKVIEVSEFAFDDNHINSERSHFVDRATAETWIGESKISINVWNGRFERYYGSAGVVYVDLESKNIRTAFSAQEFDEKTIAILEVLKKYGY